MPKNLVLCCDGTNNQFDGYHTNVVRTYKVSRRSPNQLTYYDPGVGTMPEPWKKTQLGKRLSMLAGLIFGDGFFDDTSVAYKFLMANYEPGDEIFIFGFSRGAYMARAVAAILHSVGLLQRDTEALLPYAIKYWQSDFGPQSPGGQTCAEFKATLSRPCPVHFIGVWDTVGSVGWINNFRSFPHITHNPEVTHVRHAVSIDERRSTFRQNLMSPVYASQNIKNVYFPGVHSDVGGGYAPQESGLAKLTFHWMMREAAQCHLDIDEAALGRELNGIGEPPNPLAPLHVSLKGFWWLCELLPIKRFSWVDRKPHWRWLFKAFNQPRDIERAAAEQHVFLHVSVLDRMSSGVEYQPTNLPRDEAEIREKFNLET